MNKTVIIVIVIAVAIGGYFIWKKSKKKDEKTK